MLFLRSLDSKQRQNLLILFVVGFLFWLSISALLPTLPSYIQQLGATPQQVGLVMGCFAIGLLPCRPTLGWLADRYSRKSVLLIGTLVVGIAPFGYLLFPTIADLMKVRAFHGISIAAFTTGYPAFVVDLSPLKQRDTIIGYMSLVVPIGTALGPALGGFLATSFSYSTLFWVSGSTGLLAFLLTLVLQNSQPESELEDTKTSANHNRSFAQLLQDPLLMVPSIVMALIGLVFGTLVSFLPLFVQDLNLEFNVGLFYATAAVSSFCVRVFAGRASERYGYGLLITGSTICYCLSMIIVMEAYTPQIFLLAAIFEGIGAGLLFPMMIALVSNQSSFAERGKVYAISMGGFDIGIALSGPFLGSLELLLGYRGIFLLAADFAGLATLIFMTLSRKTLVHSFRFAWGIDR